MKTLSVLQTSFQLTFLFTICFSLSLRGQIMPGTTDDFQNLMNAGWMEGAVSPNQPFIVDDGGPDGDGDAFLRNSSSGSTGAGGKWVMFNRTARWNGNFTAAGIQLIMMDVRNAGSTAINLRLAFDGAGGVIASSQSHVIPADNLWQTVSFEISPGAFVGVNGGDPIATLASTTEFRILSAATPTNIGDQIQALVDVDNVVAESSSTIQPVDISWSVLWLPEERILRIEAEPDRPLYVIEIVNALGQHVLHAHTDLQSGLHIPDGVRGMHFMMIQGLGVKPVLLY